MSVNEMLGRLTSLELSEWMAFYGLEPWGCEMEDRRSGIIASTVANVNRNKKQKAKPYLWTDWFPAHKRIQTVEEQIRILKRAWG